MRSAHVPAHGQEAAYAPRARSTRGTQAASERRRRNLTYLAVFIIATFVFGLLPPLRFLLVLNLIADVLLVLYLGLAVYMSARPPVSERSSMEPAPEISTQTATGGLPE